jgi:hypothetical protein
VDKPAACLVCSGTEAQRRRGRSRHPRREIFGGCGTQSVAWAHTSEKRLARVRRETVVRAGKQGVSAPQITATTGISARQLLAPLKCAQNR